MHYPMAANCAADVTHSVTQNLESLLSGTALLLFRALHTSAVEVGAGRNYHPNVSQVSFFCPVEAVALALGVHRSTIYRALPELRALGLVDQRAHYATHRGRTRADGAVWCVRLHPLRGCRARLSYGDLRHSYRNLSGDVEAGRTVWQLMRQSKAVPKSEGVDLSHILRWALPPTKQNPVTSDCRMVPRRDLEALLDMKSCRQEERGRMVELAAQALAAALADRSGVNFFRRLCWQLLRRFDATGEDYAYQVYLTAQRARTDVQEHFARRGGALFTSRVKQAPWWPQVWTAPPRRVGTRPAPMSA